MDLNPRYPFSPFGQVSKLTEILKQPESMLRQLAASPTDYYRSVPIIVKGKTRQTWDAKPPLKAVQARIQTLLLKRVVYPPYLLGGLPRRDYVDNARCHASKRIVITADVEGFFPSTPTTAIQHVWGGLFHFPERISGLLAGLTTLDGALPQGAKTSSYLANLIFWDREPMIVEDLQRDGVVYTRYIDDITLSSTRDLEDERITTTAKWLVAMLNRWGMRLKRSKTHVSRAGSRMTATGLTVNRGVGLPRRKRAQVRTHVFELEQMYELGEDTRQSAHYDIAWQRARGRSLTVARFHPKSGSVLLDRLLKIKPT